LNKKEYYKAFCVLLLFCACCIFAVSLGGEKASDLPDAAEIAETVPVPEAEAGFAFPALYGEASETMNIVAMDMSIAEEPDLILLAYWDEAFREDTLVFFQNMTGSREIAEAILSNASEYNVSPALAFSLCAEESGYNPRALNRNKNETADRGLFQLNNASFPKLKMEEFYDTNVNVMYGISHLRWCLNTAGTEIAALAMYNAGETRVRSVGTPKSTLDYVSRILKRQRTIEEHFADYYYRIVEERNASIELAEKDEKVFFRFSLLAPLGR
jgi:soluble lytic murein transglycosylase-like protein